MIVVFIYDLLLMLSAADSKIADLPAMLATAVVSDAI